MSNNPNADHDVEAFRKKIPYALHSTNLKGAYTTPAPPDDFDPRTASQRDLIRDGLLWRQPTAKDHPATRAALDNLFSRKWLAKDRIVPEMHPQAGQTHNLKAKPKKVTDNTFTSPGWSGAVLSADFASNWKSIYGYWNVPSVSTPTEPAGTSGGWESSSWIGIDGFIVSNDVLQAGIEQNVGSKGFASYRAWYSWYVPAPANLPPGTPVDSKGYPLAWLGLNGQYPYVYQVYQNTFQVKLGDQVYCFVCYLNNTAGVIYFANERTGQHFSITLAPPPGASFNGSSCEWIMEAPNGGEPISSLPDFTPVTFTNCIACSEEYEMGTPFNADTINITAANGTLLTSVSVGGPWDNSVTIDFIG